MDGVSFFLEVPNGIDDPFAIGAFIDVVAHQVELILRGELHLIEQGVEGIGVAVHIGGNKFAHEVGVVI